MPVEIRLSELAFADLIAVGWQKPDEIYKAVFSQEAKFMKDEKIKAVSRSLAKRPDIVERAMQTRERIEDSVRKKRDSSGPESELSSNSIGGKADRMQQLQNIADTAIDDRVRIAAIKELAALGGDKKDATTGKDDPVRFFLPIKCSGCNLFKEAVKVGFVKYDDGTKIPMKAAEEAIGSLTRRQEAISEIERGDGGEELESSGVTII